MKNAVWCLTIVVFILTRAAALGEELFWEEVARGNTQIKAVLVDENISSRIIIGTANAVLKSQDGAKSWQLVLSVRGANSSINFLAYGWQDNSRIYAATGNGLFYSRDYAKNWKRIYKGMDYLENDCKSVAVLPYGIYLGTLAGLRVSRDNGLSWHKERGELGASKILAIAYSPKEPEFIYIASTAAVFTSRDSGRSWEKIWGSKDINSEPDNHQEEFNKEEQAEEGGHFISCIAVSPGKSHIVYLGTKRGIFVSYDRGRSWEEMGSYGLLSQDIRFIYINKSDEIYAATKSGIFLYSNGRWQELSLRLMAEEVAMITQDSQGYIYAACDNGLFKAKVQKEPNILSDDLIFRYSQNEPSIQKVQEAAIHYAEVEPEKIKQWRTQAAKKAILPQLSISIQRDSSDLWHWETGSTTRSDDDILRRGRDSIEWDVHLSWDLGELIWNADQTSIDVRSRLAVELRNDILDEVTRLYFERLRLKMELDSLPIEDRKRRSEKQLRLQELNAFLDALTGGYFSKSLGEYR
ncbi:MAG: hypothetical protein NC923_02980 [Candidatus Omnitrophica bacterium]|nr:hypothetical protein [Candidatus Omnitrophota bacterium]